MDKPDIEYYWMCKRIQARAAISANVILCNAYLPMKNDLILFNTHIAELEALMPEVLVIGTGWTVNQNVAKAACTLYWVNEVCKTFKGFAKKYGKNEFLNAVNFTISKLNKVKLPLYYRAITQLNTVGEAILLDADYIAGSYSVDAGVLTAGMTLANTFLACTGVAKEISNTKNENGVEIKAKIQELRGDLDIMDDDVFGVGNTTFKNQYFTDRKLGVSSIIHNKVNLTVTDSITGFGINKVFAINEGAASGDYTDIDGFKELHKRPKTNILLLSHKDPITGMEDYVPVTIRCKPIFKGSIDVNVVMTKIVTDILALDKAGAKKAGKKGKKALPVGAVAPEIVKPIVKDTGTVKEVAVKKAAPEKEVSPVKKVGGVKKKK